MPTTPPSGPSASAPGGATDAHLRDAAGRLDRLAIATYDDAINRAYRVAIGRPFDPDLIPADTIRATS